MKHFLVVILLFMFPFALLDSQPVTGGDGAAGSFQDSTLDLRWVVEEALRNNPELKAYDEMRSVASARIPQRGSLDDPFLNMRIMEAPSSDPFNTSKWKYVNFELMQMFPFPGKLSKEEKLAGIMAEHVVHDYQEKLLDIVHRVKIAYYDLYYTQRAVEVNNENIALLNQIIQTARIRYAVGKASNPDVLKANVELAKLHNELITFEQKEETAKAMLNVLLNRDPDARLQYTQNSVEMQQGRTLEQLQRIALGNRPMVIHDSLGIVESEVNLALAKQQYLPDLRLGLEYVTSPFDGFRGWSATVGISLPFSPWTLGRRSGRVEEAAAEIQVKRAMFRNTRNMVMFAVKDAHIKSQTARRLVDLYRETILPQSEQSLQATFAAYQTQQADFLGVLDSYRTLQTFKLEFYGAMADYGKSLSELERVVGWGVMAHDAHSEGHE